MEARGFADSFALKMRHHNESLHGRHAPAELVARPMMRLRRFATRRSAQRPMPGSATIWTPQTVCGWRRSDHAAARPEEVPVPAALALMLREASDRQPVPEAARAGVDMLRGWIAERAGTDFDALALSSMIRRRFQALRSTCSSISN
jgi:cobaltochelatase CobT